MTSMLSRYQCHKQVQAGKITEIDGGDLTVKVGESGHITVHVGTPWITKHNPEVGGYLVRYDDEYQSYSPKKAFEEGYTLIGD
jgi:hypothetical protein